MLESFVLREFEPSDLWQVVRINKACLPENYSRSFFMNLHERFPKVFIVALVDNNLVGYVMCRIESSFSNLNIRSLSLAKKGHIISIAVLPEYRNKGLGKALIRVVLGAMNQYYGVKICYLEVRVSNGNAIRLYNVMGFRIEKEVRGYYSDGEHAYMMIFKL